MQNSNNLTAILKRAMELAMPDLRGYYKVPRKGKIVATYASDGKYFADVQPLLNNESPDEKEPILPQVEIPVLWGGPERGVVCPPQVGTLCDITYYDGDPNYPRISNFRWQNNKAPECEVGAFVIQSGPGAMIKIDAKKNIIHITPADVKTTAGKNATVTVGNTFTLIAPQINLIGNISSTGTGGAKGTEIKTADTRQTGDITCIGKIKCSQLEVTGSARVNGNCYAGSRSGGQI